MTAGGGANGERLQLGAVQAISPFQFRIRVRTDVSPKMRAEWTPRWPPNAATEFLEISTVDPWADPWSAGMRYQILGCTEVVNG